MGNTNTNITPPTAITLDVPISSLMSVPLPVPLQPVPLSATLSMPSSSLDTATATATATRVSMNSTTDSNINTNINNNYNCTSFRPSLISSSIPATSTMMTAQTPTTQTKLTTLYTTCSNNHWSQSTIVDAPGPYDIVCGRNSGAYKNIG